MSEHIWRIYRYYNPIEDKSYVGQTTRNVNDRAKNGKGYMKGTRFRDAINTYGWENFEQSILRLCLSQEEADFYEKYYIDKYDCINNGYNSQSGGSGGCFLDKHHTKETRKKLSESLKGKPISEETRKKISENHWDCSGEKHPMYGRTGEKNPCYGKVWYNNGTINIHININTTEVPEGFKKGMLRRSK